MKWVLRAAPAGTAAIALYFALVLGFEGLRALTLPLVGFEDWTLSSEIFGIGRVFGIGSESLLRIAAFLAAFKLVAAGILIVYLAERIGGFMSGAVSGHETLEIGLLLVIATTLIGIVPFLMQGFIEPIRIHATHAFLITAAALTIIVEGREKIAAARVTSESMDVVSTLPMPQQVPVD
ncbi:MAG TPA: hypothetical protein VHN11_06040 [Xanthobacteraceae bacterium]|jgi:hypothetical protein|nr:hypothetical protein [Xanthobacteraceae bacterium]